MTESKLKPEPARRTTCAVPDDEAFGNVVSLMALGSDAAGRLAEIEAEANAALLEIVDEFKAEYANCQAALAKAEAALEIHCRAHKGEWFGKAKSIKTPFGKVAFREGESLLVRDDEATVRLLKAIHGIDAQAFLRVQEVPDLEALEKLDDEALKKVLVKRLRKDSFSFTPAKIEFGKVVAEEAGKN